MAPGWTLPGPAKSCATGTVCSPPPSSKKVAIAPATMSAGALSAEGEALHRLPPMVAMLRSWREPITWIASTRAVNRSWTKGDVSSERKGCCRADAQAVARPGGPCGDARQPLDVNQCLVVLGPASQVDDDVGAARQDLVAALASAQGVYRFQGG